MTTTAPEIQIKLVEPEHCTGCAACAYVCPKECIEMKANAMGVMLPVIDHQRCIRCHKCQKVCPSLNPVTLREPVSAVAAWSNDPEERRTSASGGIATAVYHKALADGQMIGGAEQHADYSVSLRLTSDKEQLRRFKNSKYVFSTAFGLYGEIDEALKQDKKCTVVALPCQIAAIRKIFGDNERLTLIDLVCHGTVPVEYLRQHIAAIEKEKNDKAARMSFRDSEVAQTESYTFTLYDNNGNCFYASRGQDSYNFCFHRSISNRENCYNCQYARGSRCSDITIGDYKGHPTPDPTGSAKVSCVLMMTDKGEKLISELQSQNKITTVPKEVSEILAADPKLRGETKKSKYYDLFKKYMENNGYDFEDAIKRTMSRFVFDNRIARVLKPLTAVFPFLKK